MKAGLIQRGRKRSTLDFKGFPSLLPTLIAPLYSPRRRPKRNEGRSNMFYSINSIFPSRSSSVEKRSVGREVSDNKLPSFRGLHPRTQLQLLLLAPLRGINAFLHSRAKFSARSVLCDAALSCSVSRRKKTLKLFLHSDGSHSAESVVWSVRATDRHRSRRRSLPQP